MLNTPEIVGLTAPRFLEASIRAGAVQRPAERAARGESLATSGVCVRSGLYLPSGAGQMTRNQLRRATFHGPGEDGSPFGRWNRQSSRWTATSSSVS
jgi:hypothetical protein